MQLRSASSPARAWSFWGALLTGLAAFIVAVLVFAFSRGPNAADDSAQDMALTRAPAAGTAVCGSISADSTWSAAGSPYEICPDGLDIQPHAALTIDGSEGPVHVVATGTGGVTVDGRLLTRGTSSSNDVEFTSATAQAGSWSGISGSRATDECISLAHTRIDYAGLSALCAMSLLDVDVAHTSGLAINSETSLVMVGGSVTDGTGYDNDYPPTSGVAASGILTITGTTFSNLSLAAVSVAQPLQSVSLQHLRISSVGGSGAPGIYLTGLTASVPLSITDNVITDSGTSQTPWPAVYIVQGALDFNGIQGNRGAGNGMDAVVCTTCAASTSFTWEGTTRSAALHALGFVMGGLSLGGNTLTVPAKAVVKFEGGGIDDGSIIATAGSVFTSASDNVSGAITCPSVVATTCTPKAGDWQGIWLTDFSADGERVQLTGATFRYAALAVDAEPVNGTDAAGIPGTDATLNDVTIAHGFGGVGGLHASIAVTGGSIMDMTDNPNPTYSSLPGPLFTMLCGFGIQSAGGDLGVSGVAISDIDESGIAELGLGVSGAGNASITGNTVTRAETRGQSFADQGAIEDRGAATVSVQGNIVTYSGHGTTATSPAILISGLRGDIGVLLSGNAGHSNELDGIVLNHGYATASFAWVPQSNSATLHPLGYTGDVTVAGPQTLTVPPGVTVKAQIELDGATLDATAGGATFTSSDPRGVCITARSDSAGNPARVEVSDAAFACSGQAVSASAGSTASFTDVTVSRSVGPAIYLTGASATIAASTFDNVDIWALDSSLQVTGATFRGAQSGVLFSNEPPIGSYTDGTGTLTVSSSNFVGSQGLSIKDSTSSEYAVDWSRFHGGGVPIAVYDSTVDMGNDFKSNVAWGNTFDGVELTTAAMVGDFTWPAAVPDSSPHPLYLEAPDGLVVQDATMTVALNAVVSMDTEGLWLEGGVLDATAGGAVFQGTSSDCNGSAGCPFSGISLFPSRTGKAGASASMVDATIRNASVGIEAASSGSAAPGDDGYGVHMVGGSLSNIVGTATVPPGGDGLVAYNTAIDVEGTAFDGVSGAAIFIQSGSGSRIDGLGSLQGVATAVLDTGGATIENVAISNVGTAIDIEQSGAASIQCSTIDNNAVGIVSNGSTHTTIAQSNLTGEQNGADVNGMVATDAEHNWWGQPGGPRPGQTAGTVDSSNALAAASSCAPAG